MTHASSRHPHPPNRLLRTCLLVQPPQIISVGIGYAVKRVPTVVESSEVLGQWAGAGLLVYFGLRTLRDAWEKTEEAADDELADAEEEGAPRFRLAWPCAFARLADLCMGMRFLDWRGREVGRRLAMCRRPWRRGADARRPPLRITPVLAPPRPAPASQALLAAPAARPGVGGGQAAPRRADARPVAQPSSFLTPPPHPPTPAHPAVKRADEGGKIHIGQAAAATLLEVASLIFVAEWGDRSMLATIALGAAQSPLGVAGGAIAAHALATLVAVVGGAMLSQHISEKAVGYVGGTLFLVFAAATVFGIF